MVDFILVTGILKYVKNTISPYVDDFSALFRRFISKNSLFSLNWAKKGGFGPKFSIGLIMIDILSVTNMHRSLNKSILLQLYHFSVLIHRYLLKYAILGLFWAQNWGFGPRNR